LFNWFFHPLTGVLTSTTTSPAIENGSSTFKLILLMLAGLAVLLAVLIAVIIRIMKKFRELS